MFSTSLRSTGSHPDFTRTLARPMRSPAATGTRPTRTRRRTGTRLGEDVPNPGVVRRPFTLAQTPRRTMQVRPGPDPSRLHARVDREAFATPVVALVTRRTSALPRVRPAVGARKLDISLMSVKHRHQFSMRPSPSPSQNLLPPQFRPTANGVTANRVQPELKLETPEPLTGPVGRRSARPTWVLTLIKNLRATP